MKNRIYLFFTVIVVTALSSSCSEEEMPSIVAGKTARVFITHLSPSANPASNIEFFTSDITLGNSNRKANLAYGGSSATNPNSGNVFLKTRFANATEPFLSGNFNADDYGHYTAILGNSDGNNTASDAPLGIAVLKDNLTAAPADNAKVRLIHLAVGASDVDVYFYAGDVQPAALVTSFGYGRAHPGNVSLALSAGQVGSAVSSDFLTLPIGTYNYAIRAAGADPTSEPLLKGTISLASGRVYSVFVRGYAAAPQGVSGRNLSVLSLLHERI